jgi:hypothetical protein
VNARARLSRLEAAAKRAGATAEAKAGPLVLILSQEEYEARDAAVDAAIDKAAGSRPVYILSPEFLPRMKAAPAVMIMPRPGDKPDRGTK